MKAALSPDKKISITEATKIIKLIKSLLLDLNIKYCKQQGKIQINNFQELGHL